MSDISRVEAKENESAAGRGQTNLFDGAASLFLPPVAAQLQRAVDVGFSVIGAQNH